MASLCSDCSDIARYYNEPRNYNDDEAEVESDSEAEIVPDTVCHLERESRCLLVMSACKIRQHQANCGACIRLIKRKASKTQHYFDHDGKRFKASYGHLIPLFNDTKLKLRKAEARILELEKALK